MDYDIDFSNCLELPKEYGKYKEFRIGISGLYFWGDGYRTVQNQQDFDKMMNKLESDLDTIISERYFGKLLFNNNNDGCNTIIPSEAQYEPSNVYLHPMEFTGILQEADIERLCDFVNSFCKSIDRNDVSATISYMNDTYHINDVDYINLILANSNNIINRVQQYLNKLSPSKKERWLNYRVHEVGFDFAKTGRIKRDFNHRSGYSSSDADIKTVQTIIELAIKNGQIS